MRMGMRCGLVVEAAPMIQKLSRARDHAEVLHVDRGPHARLVHEHRLEVGAHGEPGVSGVRIAVLVEVTLG